MKLISQLTVLFFLIVLTFSCTSIKKIKQEYELFQTGFDTTSKYNYRELTIKPGDKLKIHFYTTSSTDQTQTGLFNLLGDKSGVYEVNSNGNIELSKLGLLNVAGLTSKQLKNQLTTALSSYIKDLVVEVEIDGFSVNVLGEVSGGGVKKFNKEVVTIFDLLAATGSLTPDARRENVLVIREDSGTRKSYRLDLRDAAIYSSPAFQLEQNDLVYIQGTNRTYRQIRNQDLRQTTQAYSQSIGFALSLLNTILVLLAIRR
jgi:polysaccharide export outer membrane protein